MELSELFRNRWGERLQWSQVLLIGRTRCMLGRL